MTTAIDVMIVLLLIGTLGYAVLLDRRVRALMQALRDLQPMVGEFSEAVDKSENSVRSLKSLTETIERAPRRAEPPVAAARKEEPKLQSGVRTAHGVASVSGKSDLVRGFFEASRDRDS